jgi:hypothetical protein
MMRKLIFTGLLIFSFLSSSAVFAANLWNTDATGELSGTRDNFDVGGLIATGESWPGAEISLSWEITPMVMGGTVYWQYKYTIDTSDADKAKGVSHFILEVSDADVIIMSDYEDDDLEGPQAWAKDGMRDLPGDGLKWGIKFDFGEDPEADDPEDNDNQSVYTFKTNRAPVYGSFFGKGGGNPNNELYNFAMGINDNTLPCIDDSAECMALMDANNWIVRPNGVVPLPASVWLFGTALIGLAGLRRVQAA